MQDYMRALKRQFDIPWRNRPELEKEYEQVHKALHQRLDRQERKLLLRLVDLQDALTYETSLNSFTSGYRLACGIHRELAEQPPYSFEREEEARVSAHNFRKRRRNHGKAQTVRRRYGTEAG